MENTEKVFFEDDQVPSWFVAVGEGWVGPLTASDVYEKILRGEITWAHFVWRKGQEDWKRVCDVPTFQAAVPGRPGRSLQSQVKSAATTPSASSGTAPTVRAGARKTGDDAGRSSSPLARAQQKAWFLYYSDTQFGPFSFEEVCRFLIVGKIHGRVYAWSDGMANWERLEKLVVFSEAVAEATKIRDRTRETSRSSGAARPALREPQIGDSTGAMPRVSQGFAQREASPAQKGARAKESREDQRRAPRRPLVARILLVDDQEEDVNIAICRDISIGGMQVLTGRVPGPIGAKIKMNVSPPKDGKGSRFRPFVAEGVIVRILEDGRGFSFRFDRLRTEAKRAIEEYISTPA